jgi:hypothetical protein
MITRLWHDETGSVGSAEMVLIMTIMTLGVVVGLKSFRDGAVTELADLAQALSEIDQSYSYTGFSIAVGGSTLTTVSSYFVDSADFCDTEDDDDTGSRGSKCVLVASPATMEAAPP